MTFHHVVCEVCLNTLFRPEDVVAYRIHCHLDPQTATPQKITDFQTNGRYLQEVDLKKQSPYAGVRCVCRTCIERLQSFANLETHHEPPASG
jgi:hypothetical protein